MKITIQNLGTIERTSLNLRPLTIIIGPNNTNKTYISYSVYGLWDYLRESHVNLFDEFEATAEYGDIYSFKINRAFITSLKDAVWEYGEYFREELGNFFQDSTGKIFKKTSFDITFTEKEVTERVRRHFEINKSTSIDSLKIWLEDDPFRLMIDTTKFWTERSGEESEISYIVNKYIVSLMFPKPFLLPAERNAFIITYKILANKRLKHLREIQRGKISPRSARQLEILREQGDIRYPQPIEDFLDFLSDVEFEQGGGKKTPSRIRFCELSTLIEKYIQTNNRTSVKSTKLDGREIRVNVRKGLDIDLYNASSSIKQLAPLLLYLRYRAEENDLLIIDEPEMNLHPESQAKLLEVLSMLVNAGLNILLTTHSPYFMSHLNNLVSGKLSDANILETQANSLYLRDERAFLRPEDVSAYQVVNGSLRDLRDADYGIRWDTLSNVSADLQQKFFEIYEVGEEPSNGKKK